MSAKDHIILIDSHMHMHLPPTHTYCQFRLNLHLVVNDGLKKLEVNDIDNMNFVEKAKFWHNRGERCIRKINGRSKIISKI